MSDITINNTTLTFTNIWYVDSVNGNDSTCVANDNTHPAKSVNYVSQNKAISGDAIYALAGSHNITQITGPGGLYDWGKNITYIGDSGETIFIADGTAHASRDHHAVCCYGGSTLINIIFDCNFNNRSTDYSCAFFGRDASFVKFDAYNCVFVGKNDGGWSSWVYDNSNSSIVHIYNCLVITNSTMRANYTGRVTTIQNTAFFKGIQLGSATGITNLAFAVPGDNYSLYAEGFKNAGTGTNPDGSTANIGIDGGIYAWNPDWIPPYYSKLGSVLTTPDDGWQRFDHLNPNITHLAGQNTVGWGNDTSASNYNGSEMSLVSATYPRNQHLFNFTGTKLRIIAPVNTNGVKGATIFIDGIGYSCNFYGTLTYQTVVFDIQGLTDKEHQCMIVPYFDYLLDTGGSYFYLDAIDIELSAQLKKYDNGLGGWDLTRKSPNSVLLDALDGTGTSYFCPVYHDGYYGGCLGKVGKSTGKWYFEIEVIQYCSTSCVGIASSGINIPTADGGYTNINQRTVSGYGNKGGTGGYVSYTDRWDGLTQPTIGVAVDMDVGTIEFYVDGVSRGVAYTDLLTLGTVYPYVWGNAGTTNSSSCFKLNTGGAPFKYSIPEGYTAWDSTVYGKQVKGPYLNTSSNTAMTCKETQSDIITSLVASASNGGVIGNKVITSGKYYWEVLNTGACYFGIGVNTLSNLNLGYSGGMSYGAAPLNQTWLNGTHGSPSLGVNLEYATTLWNSSNPTRTIGVLLDMDSRTIKFMINGTLCTPFADGTLPASGVVMSYCRTYSGNAGGWFYDMNVGQKAFTYELPVGYTTYGSFNAAPIDTLVVDRTTTHSNDVVLSGSISDADGDQVQYSITLNGVTIESTTSLAESPVTINYTVPLSLLTVGSNTLVVNYSDSKGASSSKTLNIEFTNDTPIVSLAVDKNVCFSNNIVLTGEITDADYVKYRVLAGETVISDWTTLSAAPVTINKSIQPSQLEYGYNTITVEVQDSIGGTNSSSVYVKRKQYDSTYITDTTSYPYSETLVLNPTNLVLVKTPDVVRSAGYILGASLTLNITSYSGTTIRVAPITSVWGGETVTSSTKPSIDVANAITLTPTGTGIHTFDITDVAKAVYNKSAGYGIAIYSTLTTAEFSIIDMNCEYDYVPTVLNIPYEVSCKGVTLDWNSFKPEGGIASFEVQKSTSSSFSSYETLLSSSDVAILETTDTNVSANTTHYYRMIVTLTGNVVETIAYITTPIPAAGYRGVWNGSEYIVTMAQGIAFDDPTTDYNFFTTPDKIKLRTLQMGAIIGGQISNVYEVEIINGYDNVNFDITLKASQNSIVAPASADGTCGLLPDASRDELKTKVEMSLGSGGAFTPVYPLTFRLNAQARRLFYIRVKPTITTAGDTMFQIVLSGSPI